MPLTPQRLPASRRATNRKLFALLLALAIAASLLLFLYLKSERRPRPTVAGWRAVVTTLAGDGAPGYLNSASPQQARFRDPFGVVIDRDGTLYVSDAGDTNAIRRITKDGSVSTFAGGREGFQDGSGASAAFNSPSALAIDSAGNLYVADTANNRIRKISREGFVTTLAGSGNAGYLDGAAATAEFNGPIGLAVDQKNNVYVADSYNDRIRLITANGEVSTIAGGSAAGATDGDALSVALFDTPCAVAITSGGELIIADTGNNRLRKLTRDKQVLTISAVSEDGQASDSFSAPIALAQTFDGFLYVVEAEGGRVKQLAPDGRVRVIAGNGSGFANGDGQSAARFNHPAGIAVDADGALFVTDGANYLLRKLSPVGLSGKESLPRSTAVLPQLTPELLNATSDFPWPVDPQQARHEVVATMGEVRGSYAGESRDHLHSGIDVQAPYKAVVRVVYDERITSPLCNWGFGGLNEGLRAGFFAYIHLRVGRDAQDQLLNDSRFIPVRDEHAKIVRVRIKRGTRFHVGDALGSVNRMYHVHLNFGPAGAEVNPLQLPFIGFSDRIAPTIERDGIHILNAAGERMTEKRNGRLILHDLVRIVVDAYDQADGNSARRRLGLYKLGYQVLQPNGAPAIGFEQTRITMLFDRLPAESEAVKIAYAEQSGITVYGSAATRFLYEITNTVRDGQVIKGAWNTAELPKGFYVLRIIAADFAGNEATANRDLPISIE